MGAGKGEPSGVAVRCSTEQSQLGEGIRWDARRSELLAVDIVAGRVYRGRVGDDGAVERVRVYQLPETVGMIAPVQGDDGWLLGAGRGFVYLALDGSHRSIADVAPAGTRMNDGACDPQGRFWVARTEARLAKVGQPRSSRESGGYCTLLDLPFLERTTGLEPATLTLAR
jgi:sugar lactone lactonase YvrE